MSAAQRERRRRLITLARTQSHIRMYGEGGWVGGGAPYSFCRDARLFVYVPHTHTCNQDGTPAQTRHTAAAPSRASPPLSVHEFFMFPLFHRSFSKSGQGYFHADSQLMAILTSRTRRQCNCPISLPFCQLKRLNLT